MNIFGYFGSTALKLLSDYISVAKLIHVSFVASSDKHLAAPPLDGNKILINPRILLEAYVRASVTKH